MAAKFGPFEKICFSDFGASTTVVLAVCVASASPKLSATESLSKASFAKLISKGTKAAAAEAAVTAAEATAVADLEEAKRLAAKFEALYMYWAAAPSP